MIIGVGTDIVEIRRIAESIQRHGDHFLQRLFTERECQYCQGYQESARHFAGRFAAKEAIVKSFGLGFGSEVGWKDIEIINDPRGKPEVLLSEQLQQRLGRLKVHLSISHGHDYAVAFALCES